MTTAYATYRGEDFTVRFSGDYESYPEGDEVVNIRVEWIEVLGHRFEIEELPSRFASILRVLANELDFTLSDSSEQDDIGD